VYYLNVDIMPAIVDISNYILYIEYNLFRKVVYYFTMYRIIPNNNSKLLDFYREKFGLSKNAKMIINKRIEKLVVIDYIKGNIGDRLQVLCRCDCSNTIVLYAQNLLAKEHTSCGCANKRAANNNAMKHNKSRTSEYRAWDGIKQRCYNTKHHAYDNYGGRGIKVCDRWLDKEKGFENFYEDMGGKLTPKHLYSIERKDVDGNYEPSNCIWAIINIQARSKRVHKNNKLGFSGIRRRNKKYEVVITVNSRYIYLGRYRDLDKAIDSRIAGELKYWGYILTKRRNIKILNKAEI